MTIIINSRPSLSSRIDTSRSMARRSTSADAIRSRLLFKLGIYDPNFTNASIYNKIRCESFATSSKDKDVIPATVTPPPLPPQQARPMALHPSISQDEDESEDISGPSATTYFVPLKFSQDPQDSCSNSPHLISSNPSSTSFSMEGSDFEPPLRIDECIVQKSAPRAGGFIQFDPTVTVIPVPSHRSYSTRMHAQLYTPKDEMNSNAVRNTREFIYEGWDWNNAVEESGMYICKASGEFVHPAHVGLKRVANPYL